MLPDKGKENLKTLPGNAKLGGGVSHYAKWRETPRLEASLKAAGWLGGFGMIMAMAGGAVIPTLFGYLKDISDIQKAYWICLPCFLFILYYGVAGYKIRTK